MIVVCVKVFPCSNVSAVVETGVQTYNIFVASFGG